MSDNDGAGGGHNVKAFGELTAVNAHVHGHRQMVNVYKIIKESAVKGVRTPRNTAVSGTYEY